MKTITKITLAAMMVLAVTTLSVEAQRGPGQGPGHAKGKGPCHVPDSARIQQKVADMDEALDLSDEQEATILQMHYEHKAEMKAKRAENKYDVTAAREARVEARKAFDVKIKEQLTDEQAGKYDAFMIGRRSACKQCVPRK